LLPQAISAQRRAGEIVRNSPSLLTVNIRLAVQRALDPLAAQHLEMVQRLLPALNGIPLGDDIPQRQVWELHGCFFTRRKSAIGIFQEKSCHLTEPNATFVETPSLLLKAIDLGLG
jgi:hypothetical protein